MIAFGISLLGISIVIMMYGGQIEDFFIIPSMLMILIPLLFILTITRCYKVFSIGLRAAFFPRNEISDEMRKYAISLYRLLSKTAAIAAGISVFIAMVIILMNTNFAGGMEMINTIGSNILFAIVSPLYSLLLIAFIFKPVIFILKKNKNSNQLDR